MLYTTENSAFNGMYSEVASDIEKKKSEPTNQNMQWQNNQYYDII